jgi:PhnB protein
MTKAKNPIPEGLSTITPHLTIKGAAQAMEFYKKAFGAIERNRMGGPGGMVMHASMKIGNSTLFLADEFPEMGDGTKGPSTLGATSVVITLYVEDADKIYNQAVAAGGKPIMPMGDQFWGDRYGMLADPFGHIWAIATRIEDLTPEEMEKRGKEMMSQMAQHKN